MNIKQSLYYLLANDTDLIGAVSNRIYPSIVPQNGALPCVTYQKTSGIRDQELAAATGFVTSEFQISCWAKTYKETRQIADLVRLAIASQTGTIQGVYVHDIQLLNEMDMPQIDPESENISRYGKRLDFQVFYAE